jgi:hypothetical protein
MSADVRRDRATRRVTPEVCEGALGTGWTLARVRTQSRAESLGSRVTGKLEFGGADMGQHLSFTDCRQTGLRAHRGQNRIREIRPSGIAGGLAGTWP